MLLFVVVVDSGVYFDVGNFKHYGVMTAAATVDNSEGPAAATDKRDPRDFALWKTAKRMQIRYYSHLFRASQSYFILSFALQLASLFGIHLGAQEDQDGT